MPGYCIIDLLRHGETGLNGFCGSLDVPLNATGWQQMHDASKMNLSWQVIISSPLRRCAEFANVFAKQKHLPCLLDDRLRELDFGEWEGQHTELLLRKDPEGLSKFWADPWAYTPPNGERLVDFERRVRAAWEDSCVRYSGKYVLFITHGGVIRMLLHLVRQLPRTDLLNIDVPYASLHTLNTRKSDLLCSSDHC